MQFLKKKPEMQLAIKQAIYTKTRQFFILNN